MPVAIALAVMAAAQIGAGLYSANKAEKEQTRLANDQEQARIGQVRNEIGKAQQRTRTALVGASTRNKGTSTSGTVLGGLPSLQAANAAPGGGAGGLTGAPGSSGTF